MLPGKGQHCLFMVWFLHDPGGEISRKTRHVGQRASPPTDSLRRLWQSTRFLCGAMKASRPTRIFNVCMQLQHVLWGTVLTAPEHCLYKNLRQASVSLFHSPHAEDKALFIPAKICHGAAALQKGAAGRGPASVRGAPCCRGPPGCGPQTPAAAGCPAAPRRAG